MDMGRDRDTEEEIPLPSQADLLRARLKTIANYALLAIALIISIVALVIAASNNQSQSDKAQLGELVAKVNSLNSSLAETKGELENLKFAAGREKSAHGDELKKIDERDAKIIQHVSRLQTKLKVSPTLEDQLREVVSVPTPAPAVAAAPPISAPVATPSVVAEKKQTASVSAAKAAEKTPVQAKALKDAIEKLNKK